MFICGGAFNTLDKIIERRVGNKEIGFKIKPSKTINKKDSSVMFEYIETEDLLKFGMIPEFVGRLSVVATLSALDEKALVEVLTKPKNALSKQYKRYFDMEGVKLTFTDDALEAIAKKAISKKTGARALRSILEEIMLETMYEMPSVKDISECIITKESVIDKKSPELVKSSKKPKKVA